MTGFSPTGSMPLGTSVEDVGPPPETATGTLTYAYSISFTLNSKVKTKPTFTQNNTPTYTINSKNKVSGSVANTTTSFVFVANTRPRIKGSLSANGYGANNYIITSKAKAKGTANVPSSIISQTYTIEAGNPVITGRANVSYDFSYTMSAKTKAKSTLSANTTRTYVANTKVKVKSSNTVIVLTPNYIANTKSKSKSSVTTSLQFNIGAQATQGTIDVQSNTVYTTIPVISAKAKINAYMQPIVTSPYVEDFSTEFSTEFESAYIPSYDFNSGEFSSAFSIRRIYGPFSSAFSKDFQYKNEILSFSVTAVARAAFVVHTEATFDYGFTFDSSGTAKAKSSGNAVVSYSLANTSLTKVKAKGTSNANFANNLYSVLGNIDAKASLTTNTVVLFTTSTQANLKAKSNTVFSIPFSITAQSGNKSKGMVSNATLSFTYSAYAKATTDNIISAQANIQFQTTSVASAKVNAQSTTDLGFFLSTSVKTKSKATSTFEKQPESFSLKLTPRPKGTVTYNMPAFGFVTNSKAKVTATATHSTPLSYTMRSFYGGRNTVDITMLFAYTLRADTTNNMRMEIDLPFTSTMQIKSPPKLAITSTISFGLAATGKIKSKASTDATITNQYRIFSNKNGIGLRRRVLPGNSLNNGRIVTTE